MQSSFSYLWLNNSRRILQVKNGFVFILITVACCCCSCFNIVLYIDLCIFSWSERKTFRYTLDKIKLIIVITTKYSIIKSAFNSCFLGLNTYIRRLGIWNDLRVSTNNIIMYCTSLEKKLNKTNVESRFHTHPNRNSNQKRLKSKSNALKKSISK